MGSFLRLPSPPPSFLRLPPPPPPHQLPYPFPHPLPYPCPYRRPRPPHLQEDQVRLLRRPDRDLHHHPLRELPLREVRQRLPLRLPQDPLAPSATTTLLATRRPSSTAKLLPFGN